jgi:hypothetical protein
MSRRLLRAIDRRDWLDCREFAAEDTYVVIPGGGGALHQFAGIATQCVDRIVLLRMFLEFGHESDRVDSRKRTALHIAAMNGAFDLVRAWPKADLNCVDDLGNTALHYAAETESYLEIEHAIQRGCRLDVENKRGFYAIHAAINSRRPSLIVRMLARGDQACALHCAMLAGYDSETLRDMVAKGATGENAAHDETFRQTCDRLGMSSIRDSTCCVERVLSEFERLHTSAVQRKGVLLSLI